MRVTRVMGTALTHPLAASRGLGELEQRGKGVEVERADAVIIG